MKKIARIIILLLSLTFMWGCALAWIGAGAGLGVGTYKYIEGNVVYVYPLAYDAAWDAANNALANLFISISKSMSEDHKGTIDAVRKDGKKVVIKLEEKTKGITEISIRIGLLGDREDAEKIHEEIKTVAGLK